MAQSAEDKRARRRARRQERMADPEYRARVREQKRRYWESRGTDKQEYQRGWHKKRRQEQGPASWARKGLTRDDFERLYAAQSGKCGLCGCALANWFGDEQGAEPQLDHCHDTGRARGLLCRPCNTALGHYEKWEPDVLAQYLAH